jgi:polyhydroxybutyrate depolymerase
MRKLTLNGFERLADTDNFIVIYPNGIDKSWNDGGNVSPSGKKNIDDVGFVKSLSENLKQHFNIDPGRIYATGMSNGAYFSYRLACELPDIIAGIAPVAGPMAEVVSNCCDRGLPLPVIILLGTKDPFAVYNGGKTSDGRIVLSGEDTARYWAKKNSCDPVPVIRKLPDTSRDGTDVTEIFYANSKNGADVILYSINGGGHTWPGGWQYMPKFLVGNTSKDIDANKIIWEFFKNHPKK